MFVVVLVSMMYRLFLVEYSDVYSMLIIFFCKTLCIFVLVCSSYFIPCLLTVSFCVLLDGPKVPEEPEVLEEEQQEER